MYASRLAVIGAAQSRQMSHDELIVVVVVQVVGGHGGTASRRPGERVTTRPEQPFHLLAVQRLLLEYRLALGAADGRRLVRKTVAARSHVARNV